MDMTSQTGIFTRYWERVAELLGGESPRHKATAIRGTAAATFAADGETNVQRLWAAMEASHWARPDSNSDMNWAWRDSLVQARGSSTEVALERRIIALGASGRWSYQMPTSSGVEGSITNRRRSIDLVHRTGDDHYTFIELKGWADQPLYAAFEVLGYGLAYLHARRHRPLEASIVHRVMSARRIDLLVLGPRDWYTHRQRDGTRQRYRLDQLETAIDAGVAALSASERATLPEGMGFRFAEYDSAPEDPDLAAREIIDRLSGTHGSS